MNAAKTDAWEAALIDLLFLNTACALVGDASGLQPSATAGSLYLSAHTADPGEAGDQTTSECAYTSYARVAVARSGAGWARTLGVIANVASIAFPACTASPGSPITHIGIGCSSSAAGKLLYRIDLGSPVTVTVDAIPTIAVGLLTVGET